MSEQVTVLSMYRIDEGALELMRGANSGVRVFHTPTLEDMEAQIAEADVILSLNFSDGLLHRAKKLVWFQSVGAGVNHLLTEDFVKRGVLLTNARGNHAIPVSEHAFALLLALTRRLYLCHGEENILDRWDRVQGDELCGGVLGVLGMGNIGREVARKAKAFGMTVRGFDEVPSFLPYVDQMLLGGQVQEFFRGLDAVVITAALTSTTAGIVNNEHISLMNRGSYVVNVARGPLLVEQDLIEAVGDGRLTAAGLDVFDEEPLPADNPLRSIPNVVLTPHIGGFNPRYADRVITLFTENFRRWSRGENLINAVNVQEAAHWHDEGRSS